MEGDRDGGVGGEVVFLGGEKEGSEGAPALTRLEREKSVQYLWMSPHPILKFLQNKKHLTVHNPRHSEIDWNIT